MNTPPEFAGFPKLSRLNREIIVTCKLDGTNAQVHITEAGEIFAGSRTRWITPANDNFGFAAWVEGNKEDLLKLGPGAHFGEWYGQGIQRGYGLKERRFALFNTQRWGPSEGSLEIPPACCRVVPVLYRGPFSQRSIEECLAQLRDLGSVAAPGFRDPEGVVVYHTAAKIGFKIALIDDEKPKGQL
jgi:hypothetical protein